MKNLLNKIAIMDPIEKALKVGIPALFAAILMVFLAFVFVEKVPEGKVAVVYTPSGGATKVLDPGWHLVGFFDKTQMYPTRITIVDSEVAVTTTDGKKVDIPVKYEMKVEKSKVLDIFSELGSQNIEQIQEGYLYQRLFASSREVVAKYSVLDIFGTKTTEASAKLTEMMYERSKDMGFMITNVTLGSPNVDEKTKKSIDARVEAAQTNELMKIEIKNAQLEAEKNLVAAKGKSDKEREEARGLSDAAVIKAEGEKKANDLIAKSLNDKLLKKLELEARMKQGWVTIQGGNPIVDAKEAQK